MTLISRSITITGTVQGVGFRPFVTRVARSLGLTGTVGNTQNGVHIIVNGPEPVIETFITAIREQSPPLACIDLIQISPIESSVSSEKFSIIDSKAGEKPTVEITPDTAVCRKCLQEMNSADDRRFAHPFINCTECGPRYSIIHSIPYDRHNTAMKEFSMCPECGAEYSDQISRRFHAQPVCCPSCGPKLKFLDNKGNGIGTDSGGEIETVKRMLAEGNIVAVKGIGGFHLACLATRVDVVHRLRESKLRGEKPFACMIRDLESAEQYAVLTSSDRELLSDPRAPVVLLQKTKECDQLIPMIAPGLSTIGLMLPYTPVHHLLFKNAPYDCLVMTSANAQGEPMYIDDHELINNRDAFCDAILTHDRPIVVRLDDSIVRPVDSGTVIMRRGRGYVPSSVKTPFPVDGIIGLGAQMKNSLSVGQNKSCFVSEYMGTTDSVAVVDECVKTLKRILGILQVKPRLFANDLHPSGIDSQLFDADLPAVKVQHHHAHAAACMGENALNETVISVIYDGTGLGDDGTLWGSEIFLSNYLSYKRMAHLQPISLIGNDAAIENPGRIALAMCANGDYDNDKIIPWMDFNERSILLSLLEKSTFMTKATGMGRLFDACAALIGVCKKRTYEGQPAIELEGCADPLIKEYYPFTVNTGDDKLLMDGRSILYSVIEDRDRGIDSSVISARFHNAIVEMTVKCVSVVSEQAGVDRVVLSGGCFGNRLLLERMVERLRNEKIKVYLHKRLPPGDENVSFGQVLIAAAREKEGLI
ncbi:MAG: carbamoyltransferase HypF [Fibrobacter sp.]|nr:carbamoyltransferase HypF [Fibrobacter sp.]